MEIFCRRRRNANANTDGNRDAYRNSDCYCYCERNGYSNGNCNGHHLSLSNGDGYCHGLSDGHGLSNGDTTTRSSPHANTAASADTSASPITALPPFAAPTAKPGAKRNAGMMLSVVERVSQRRGYRGILFIARSATVVTEA